MKIEGRCHCGKIAYEAVVDPDTVTVCHCTDCQTLTGSAYRANIAAPAESFVLRTGQPKIYIKTAESGAKRAHAFPIAARRSMPLPSPTRPPIPCALEGSSSAPSCIARSGRSGAVRRYHGRWICEGFSNSISSEANFADTSGSSRE